MRTLIAGVGALGGTIATRAIAAGIPIWLATRSAESARALRSTGMKVSGAGGSASVASVEAAAMEEYEKADKFDLIVLATKAHDALDVAPFLARLLSADGTLLPIQNGGVSQLLFDRFGEKVVVGGLSNLGATMVEPGVYEQKNAGYLLIGELAGGLTDRVARILQALKGGIEVKATPNFGGAVWAKLLLNCSVTTIGAVAGQTMRHYIATSAGIEVFRNAYDEALRIALAAGARPERMIVEPMPPGWDGARSGLGTNYDAWVEKIIVTYGDLKPSMLQDFERRRRTEIDFINGYVTQLGKKIGMPAALNAAIAETVHLIEQGRIQPGSVRLEELARRCASINEEFEGGSALIPARAALGMARRIEGRFSL
jgi:2-dehydropantoate 2-reductase